MFQVGMAMVVSFRDILVSMRSPFGPMRFHMLVGVTVRMLMDMRVGMVVHDIAMTVRVLVHMFMFVTVLVPVRGGLIVLGSHGVLHLIRKGRPCSP